MITQTKNPPLSQTFSPSLLSLRPASFSGETTMGSKNKKNKKPAVTSAAAAAEPEPEQKATHGNGDNNRGKKLITDPRFASSHSDPRFQTHTKQKSKVEIDSRFKRMFTDKNFSNSSISIDKRGKAKRNDTPNPLEHYYRMDEEEKEKNEVKQRNEEAVSDDNDESDESEKSSDDEGEKERKIKLKKVWEQLSESDAESESESGSELEGESDDVDDHDMEIDRVSSDSDFDSEDEVFSEEEQIVEENIPDIDKETRRLAVVNMDWNQVKAADLYVLLSSFLPKKGQILSVSVYPSEFGLKRMEEEAVHGPVGLFDDDKKKSESDEEDNEEELDNEKLRAYELSRLKYYYAVVECDSIATADYLYKTCDGVEFERSSNKLDLRFIPDSMEFKHAPPRDVAKEAPADYEGVDFQTRALQQSKIQLTWDEDEQQRSKTFKRTFNADQLAELELNEFLASEESESDEDENENDTGDRSGERQKKQEMYRALIQSGDGSDGDEEEEGQDMEVTFKTGLEDISKKFLEKRDKESETVWEAYQRKRKEKRKERKNRSKDSSDDDSDTDREPTEEPNDFFIEEEPTIKEHKKASGKSGKNRKKAVETAEEEATRAELELLLADNNGESAGVKGYNLKRKKSKGKKGEDVLYEEKIPKVDYEDERFSAIFTSHHYALDPTDPQFKRSAVHARQIVEKKRMEKSNKQNGQPQVLNQVEKHKDEPVPTEDLSAKKDKYELSSLVKSIKMKSKNIPISSNGKKSGRKGK